jgi:hypothetical protein
MEEDKEGG